MADEPIQTLEGSEPEVLTPTGTTGEENTPANNTPTSMGGSHQEVDYKKKFSDSAREVQRLLEEDKLKNQRIAELEAQVGKPTASYEDDIYSDEGKLLLKKQQETEAKLNRLLAEKQLEEDINHVKSKFPELTGQEKSFREYTEKYPGVDAETLAKSFLFDMDVEKKPRKGLEKPSGGTKVPASGEGFTAEEVARIRETDEKRYLELIKKGVLKGKDIK